MNKKYDILIVGAGLSAATICTCLKHKYSILVVECRDHIGGNCYDEKLNDGYIHKYGPHIFHTNDKEIVDFLSNFTEFLHFKYTVKSEFIHKNIKKEIHFPISSLTKSEFSHKMNRKEIIDIFFRHYSEKMWGEHFENIEKEIISRIPINYNREYSYFHNNKYELLPKNGYTKMFKKMFKGCDIILNANKDMWRSIKTQYIIYTGRADIITESHILPYRSIDIIFNKEENTRKDITSLNFCHKDTPYTRKIYHDFFYNSNHKTISYELPREAYQNEISPFYPIPKKENKKLYEKIKKEINQKYPNIFLLGRLGTYQYLDMDQCIKEAIKFCKIYFPDL